MANSKNSSALFYLLMAIVLWAPLPKGSFTELYWHFLAALVFLLGTLFCALLVISKSTLSPVLRKSWLPIVALLCFQCWVFTQYALGLTQSPYNTLVELQLGIAYTLFFILCLQLIDTKEKLKLMAIAVVLAGTFQAFYGSFMTLSGLEYGFLGKKDHFLGVATGTFKARTHFAGYMEMCLAVAIGLMLSQLRTDSAKGWQDHWRRLLETLLSPKFRLRLYLIIMVVGLVLSRSRMGNSAFFISVTVCGILALYLQRKQISKSTKHNVILFFISMALIDVLIVSNWFGIEKLLVRIENTSAVTIVRDEAVRDAMHMWRDNPLTGTGGGTFHYVLTEYRGVDVPNTLFTAYNDYAELGAEYGIIGIIPLGFIVLYCLWQGIRAQVERRSRLLQGMGFASTMGIVALLIHSFSDFNMHIPANALTFMMILAFGCIARNLPRDKF